MGSVRRFWLRHPEWTLAGVSSLAWMLFLVQPAPVHRHTNGGYPWGLPGHWLLMVAAMMLPPALPMARHVMQNSKKYRRQRAGFLFAGASLLLWAGVGLVVTVLAYLGSATGGRGRWLLGGSLLAAAVWELTPHKSRALKACHRTIPLPPDGHKADRACVALGLRYSRACFRAGWAMMLPMALAGHPGVVLMLVITAVAVSEEVVRRGYRLAPAASVVFSVAGLMVLVLG